MFDELQQGAEQSRRERYGSAVLAPHRAAQRIEHERAEGIAASLSLMAPLGRYIRAFHVSTALTAVVQVENTRGGDADKAESLVEAGELHIVVYIKGEPRRDRPCSGRRAPAAMECSGTAPRHRLA